MPSDDEREAFLAMKNSFFEVQDVRSPDVARLRRIGSDQILDIRSEGAFGRRVKSSAVVVYLVPYPDGFATASFPIFFLGEFVTFLESVREQKPDRLVPGLDNPLLLGAFLESVTERNEGDDDDLDEGDGGNLGGEDPSGDGDHDMP